MAQAQGGASALQQLLNRSRNVQQTQGNGQKEKKQALQEIEAIQLLIKIPGITAQSLQTRMFLVRKVATTEEVYNDILHYIRNSQCHGFGIKVLDVIRTMRRNDREFEDDPSKKDQFRMMLWHGTKASCIGPILQEGFKIPQFNTAKPQMFGTAIYFSDRASKSAQYCDNITPGSVGYLLLCDVLLGFSYTARKEHHNYTRNPVINYQDGRRQVCDSVRCAGKNVPEREAQKGLYGSWMSLGKTVPNTRFRKCELLHNEYAIYNPEQVKVKYVVKVEFQQTRSLPNLDSCRR